MNYTRFGWYIGGCFLAAIWLSSAYILYQSYQELALIDLAPSLASFVTASATVILVGVTYLYVNVSKNMVEESRKDVRRDAVIDIIINGIDPLLAELDSQNSLVLSDGNGNLQIPNYSPDPISSTITQHKVVDIELELEENIESKLVRYDNNWKKYIRLREQAVSSLAEQLPDYFYNSLSQEKKELITRELDEIEDKIEKERAYPGNNWKDSYPDAPGMLITDKSEELSEYILKASGGSSSDHHIYEEDYADEDYTQRRIDIEPAYIYNSFQQFLLSIRDEDEFQKNIEEMRSIVEENTELRHELIVKLDMAKAELMEEYNILHTHITRES